MNNLDKNVNDVIEDLKLKIDSINLAAADAEGDTKIKVNEIKDKAISTLNVASQKVIEAYKSIADSEEVIDCINIVKNKSKVLYDKTIVKINEIKMTKAYQDTSKFVDKTLDQVKSETSAFISSAKDNIDDFFVKEELSNTIDKAKTKTVDMAQKGVDILKQWLKPGDDNK